MRVFVVFWLLLASSPALADLPRGVRGPASSSAPPVEDPFARPFAMAVYGTGHAGSYLAGGGGGRLRWEAFPRFGFEVYLELTVVDGPHEGARRDVPNGFNVYVPLRQGDLRIRPFFGFCDVLSFVTPDQPGAPVAHDVLLGAHIGIGTERIVRDRWTVFGELVANLYAGHDRNVMGWTSGVGGDLVPFWYVQINLGAQLHVGRARP